MPTRAAFTDSVGGKSTTDRWERAFRVGDATERSWQRTRPLRNQTTDAEEDIMLPSDETASGRNPPLDVLTVRPVTLHQA